MKVGFVNIFGKPNAGKSTLLNTLIGEKLAIVSPKVQTTRHRIKGFLNSENYQVIFSDTPGIIEPRYKLHEKMMHSVKSSLEDADLALLLADVNENPEETDLIFSGLRLKVPAFVVLNKVDRTSQDKIKQVADFFNTKPYCKKTIAISALKKMNTDLLLSTILEFLPEGEPFYDGDDLTDLPTRFFIGEMIREKIFDLFQDEIPYHTAVVVREFKEKISLIKITAEIIVHRESQKAIILGEKGKMIRQIGTTARQEIEKFLGSKVFLELFVKVRPKWRDNDIHLKEYGY
ncbi:MAG TPA: GTPase Era [Flavipsychrobacter sp.]|uniref:GTPase Era n=1 Tax=Agriterribacter sp. TaxID=2821509 RepID=UPI002D17D68E|nr:GTPase Era [Agriterribacter sp.]HTN09164.1 GTPase Era [Agriterribacter sp.]HTN47791.1 GTPase Era [Flavipsychrobacter sp.]